MSRRIRQMQKLDRLALQVTRACGTAAQELVGLEATLIHKGEYCGRNGVITAVIPDESKGFRALLMILRADGSDYLNSSSRTRSYWPLDAMTLTGRRVFGGPS